MFQGLLEVTGHADGTLRVLIANTLEKGAEAFNDLGDLDELAWLAGEDPSHEEWLGEESLELVRPCTEGIRQVI